MLVLIPNPNQTAQLVKLQKAFIGSHQGFYQQAPLWIFLKDENFSGRDFNKDELKQFSAEITKVELEQPEVYFSDSLQRVVLGSGVSVCTASGVCRAELIICGSVGSQGGAAMVTARGVTEPETSRCTAPLPNLCFANVQGSAVQGAFPTKLKIFRVANAVRLDQHSLAVSDFVWKKINKEG